MRAILWLILLVMVSDSTAVAKSYQLEANDPPSALLALTHGMTNRPFRADFLRLSPLLDYEKPLASIDYGGFVFSSGLLIGSVDNKEIVALSLPGLRPVWTAPIVGGLTSPPVVVGGWIYFSDRSGYFYRAGVADGVVTWKSRLDSFVARPISKVGTSIFLITARGTLYRLDGATGQTVWAVDHESSGKDMTIRSQTAPLVVNSVVYVGSPDGNIIAHSIETGKEAWRNNPRYSSAEFKEIVGELVFSEGRIIFARYDGTVGSFQVGDPQGTVHLWENGKNLASISSAGYRAGRYYVGTSTGQILSYSSHTGKLIWRQNVGVGISHLSAGERSLYVSTSSGLVMALDVHDGQIRWYDELGANVVSPPIYRDRNVYFATGNRNLYGYRVLP